MDVPANSRRLGVARTIGPLPLCGGNAKRVLFGAINLEMRHRLLRARKHGRGEDFRAFMEEVHRCYRGRHIALLLDEDAGHTAAASQGKAAEWKVELPWLPKRSPHLKPMDHLWRHGKEVMSANHQYDSIDEQVAQCIDYLATLSPWETFIKAGMLSEDFWLKP